MAVTGDLIVSEVGIDTFYAFYTDGILRDSEGNFILDANNDLIYNGYVTAIGPLYAKETGTDTFTAAGTIGSNEGYLNVSEVGIDTFTAEGIVGQPAVPGVTGVLNVTEGASDTFLAYGIVGEGSPIVASSSSTLPKFAIYTMDSLTSKKTKNITETIFLNRDNVICLQLFADGLPADLSSVTKVILVNMDSALNISSVVYPNMFDWSLGLGKISMDLADLSITPGEYFFYLVLFDKDNLDGIVWEVFSVNFMITYN